MRNIKNIGDVETLPVDVIIKEPVRENMRVLFSHIGRYVIAARKLNIRKTDRILDASCGEGYGSYYLSTLAEKVYGIDVSEENLEYARKHFGVHNISFLKYFDFLRRKTKIDKVVCIETLEHVDKDNSPLFIRRLVRTLRSGGDMFLTVPIGENAPSDYNPFHKNEPSIDVIYNSFIPYFSKIDIEISSFVNSYGEKTNFALVTMFNKGGKV